jgi:hypothetical protein
MSKRDLFYQEGFVVRRIVGQLGHPSDCLSQHIEKGIYIMVVNYFNYIVNPDH